MSIARFFGILLAPLAAAEMFLRFGNTNFPALFFSAATLMPCATA